MNTPNYLPEPHEPEVCNTQPLFAEEPIDWLDGLPPALIDLLNIERMKHDKRKQISKELDEMFNRL